MQFLTELSSSQLLVSGALILFGLIIVSSIFIRVRSHHGRRNTLPNHTRQTIFGFFRRRHASLVKPPAQNHELVSRARPKENSLFDGELAFDFAAFNAVSSNSEESVQTATVSEDVRPIEITNELPLEREGNDASFNVIQGAQVAADFVDESDRQNIFNEINTYSNEQGEDLNEWSDTQQVHTEPEGEYREIDVQTQDSYIEESGWSTRGEEIEVSETMDNEILEDSTRHAHAHIAASNIERQSSESFYTDDEPGGLRLNEESGSVESVIVPFNGRTVGMQRANGNGRDNGPSPSPSVVSVCLVSDYQGQVYRDIRGEQLATFLNNRGFILFGEEYHMQNQSMVEKGGIRARNFEKSTPINELVKRNEETTGFRLYFFPSESPDPLRTLSEMLNIAQSAIGFFGEVCSKPLVIYTGHTPFRPLTQEDYNALKHDLNVSYKRESTLLRSRTTLSRVEFAPSEELPQRAEQY